MRKAGTAIRRKRLWGKALREIAGSTRTRKVCGFPESATQAVRKPARSTKGNRYGTSGGHAQRDGVAHQRVYFIHRFLRRLQIHARGQIGRKVSTHFRMAQRKLYRGL